MNKWWKNKPASCVPPREKPMPSSADQLIAEVTQEIQDEASDRRRAKLKAAIRDLQAARTVVKTLEQRVQQIAEADDDLFA